MSRRRNAERGATCVRGIALVCVVILLAAFAGEAAHMCGLVAAPEGWRVAGKTCANSNPDVCLLCVSSHSMPLPTGAVLLVPSLPLSGMAVDAGYGNPVSRTFAIVHERAPPASFSAA